ncbi:cadmium resistance transporter [Mycolicibacterium tokaiense]|uniref:Permease, cadmium resistance protein n=1 Tax=Mycolicibacterium tokaiense TaxID=39695 RepID=A0A379PM99_9MYCO|nr:cadmium resistance transporter [Mycolicibacterium tokaiense]SUE94991.1 permease, cadmium resistance protein [Mycolicibacterium tokaiense]
MGFHSKLVALAVLSPATLVQAIATFAITNIDDIVVLAVMFGQAPGHRGAAIRVTAGQYLGFTAILAVSVGGALLGATLLPPAALPYFGLLPIVLGLRAAWLAWRDRRTQPAPTDDPATLLTPGTWQVAVITFANGGDNIGVYVPIFAVSTIATIGVTSSCSSSVWPSGARPADISPPTRSSPKHSHAGATSFCPLH